MTCESICVFPPSEKAGDPDHGSLSQGRVGAPEGGVHAGGGAGQRLLRRRLQWTLEKPHQSRHQDAQER